MKKGLILAILVASFVVVSAQSNSNITPIPPHYENARFVLYPTANMWNFIKLDTQTGKLWMVQYSVENNNRGETTLSDEDLLLPFMEPKVGRFALYPTQNIYNFVMIDQFNGRTWQVQWAINDNEHRWARSISDMNVIEKKSNSVDTYSASYNHEYKDLGLPSGTLWATCNLGASAPEEYGDYFAWGETQPKEYFSSKNYKFLKNDKLTKYNNDSATGYWKHTDTLKVLTMEDDAAAVLWGGTWHIPTEEQWKELVDTNYCTTSAMTINGIEGILVTSKKNSQFVFIPKVPKSPYNVGLYGYWTSTLSPYSEMAVHASVSSSYIFTFVSLRFDGLPIRPVKKK